MKTIFAFLMSITLASSAVAQTVDWEKEWSEALIAAKKEEKLTIIGSPDPVMRKEIIPKFTAVFGIKIEFIAGGSGQLVGRIRLERQSKIYSVDVFMAGATTTINVLHPENMLDPLKPLLVLPEVTEGANWKRGKPWFVDREEQYILMLFSSINGGIFINTDYVKLEEVRSARDFLNPKWKGKISTQDPTLSGSAANSAVDFYSQLGAEFVRKLYIDQKPIISNDRRQLTDWLARGTYPICLTCRGDDVQPLLKDGFKLYELDSLDGLKSRVVSAPFLLSVANKAPHPNAARIFVNWIASGEALETYSRFYGNATLRSDVDESFLDPKRIPQPNVAYLDDTDAEWISNGRKQASDEVRNLLRGQK